MNIDTQEKLLILIENPRRKGWTIGGKAVGAAIVCSFLVELLLEKSIEYQNDRLYILKRKSTLSETHNEILQRIERKRRPLKLKTWVSRLLERSDRYKRIIWERINQKGFLEKVTNSFWIFSWSWSKVKAEIVNEIILKNLN